MILRTGWDVNFGLLPYGPDWRSRRREFWHHFQPGAVEDFNALQVEGARRLLVQFLEAPDQVADNVR